MCEPDNIKQQVQATCRHTRGTVWNIDRTYSCADGDGCRRWTGECLKCKDTFIKTKHDQFCDNINKGN